MTPATVTEQPLRLEPITDDRFLDPVTEPELERAAAVRARLVELFGPIPGRRAIVD